MPLLTAILALVAVTSAAGLLSHVLDTRSVATDLAILIGLGVGVDYGLFIVSRHRADATSPPPGSARFDIGPLQGCDF